jgi:cytochrome b561
MQWRNTTIRWGAIAQLFHWIIVILIVVQVTLGLIAHDLHGFAKFAMLLKHKSVGITILGLATLRLLWRWMNPTPALPDTLKPWERVAAKVTHAGLYVLLFAMPLTGWANSSAANFPVRWFGLVTLPRLLAPDKIRAEFFEDVHHFLAWCLLAVATLHIAAAMKHHFTLKDDVLKRMLPFSSVEK